MIAVSLEVRTRGVASPGPLRQGLRYRLKPSPAVRPRRCAAGRRGGCSGASSLVSAHVGAVFPPQSRLSVSVHSARTHQSTHQPAVGEEFSRSETAWLSDGRGWDRTKLRPDRPGSTEGDSANDLQGKDQEATEGDDRPRPTENNAAFGQQA